MKLNARSRAKTKIKDYVKIKIQKCGGSFQPQSCESGAPRRES